MMTIHHLMWALLNSIWQSAVLAILVWLLTKALFRSTAAQRYATWSAAMAAALLLPFANFALVQIVAPHQVRLALPLALAQSREVVNPTVTRHAQFADVQAGDVTHPRTHDALLTQTVVLSPAPAQRPLLAAFTQWIAGRSDVILLVVWLLFANLCLGRLALGYTRLRAAKKRLAIRVLTQSEQAQCLAMTRRPVAIGYSSDIPEPCVIGFAEPAIALPLDIALRFSTEDTERIVRHECAHVARWDDYGNLAKQIALAVLCFNPVAYAIAKAIDLEREIACDDAAAIVHADRADFARCLCDIALLRVNRRWLPTTGLAKDRRQLFVRVRRLLDRNHARSTRLGASSRIAIGCIVAAAIPFAFLQVMSPAASASAANKQWRAPAPAVRVEPSKAATVTVRAFVVHDWAQKHIEHQTVVVPAAAAPALVVARLAKLAPMPARLYVLRATSDDSVRVAALQPLTVAVIREQQTSDSGRDPFLDALRQAGFNDLTVDDVIAIRNAGVSPQFLAALHSRGLTPMPARDLISLANAGVDADYLAGLRADGYGNTSVRDMISLHNAGVQPSYIAALAAQGYRNLSVADLIRLANNGVTPAFLARLQQSGVIGAHKLSIDDLIRLNDAGI